MKTIDQLNEIKANTKERQKLLINAIEYEIMSAIRDEKDTALIIFRRIKPYWIVKLLETNGYVISGRDRQNNYPIVDIAASMENKK